MKITFTDMVAVILFICLILVFVYVAIYPEESIIASDKFKYNNDLKPKESYVQLTRTISIIFAVIFSFGLIISLISI